MALNQNLPPRDLSQRLTTFAAHIIRLTEELPEKVAAKKVSDQLLRSAMSVGANYEEARGAESKADFTHKLAIALKEMRETRYWLCLLVEAGIIASKNCNDLIDEATQLRAILAKSVATSKGTARNPS
jgi:four helix bundle protein